MRNELQRKITLLSFSFHDKAEAGDLLSRAIQDVERIRFLTGRSTVRIAAGTFLMLITAGVMIWINPQLGLLAMLAMPLLNLIANVSIVAILWYGGMLVINHQLTLGELVAFTTYVAQLVVPVRSLGMVLPAITMASASAERVFEILDTLPDVVEQAGAPALAVTQGYVRFEQVSFSYGRHSDVLSVDTETEHLIQLALERVMHARTTFVIAHRLSTVQCADLILLLDKGRLVARGKHEEL